jgi:protein O-GlcNAc transferase
VDELLERITYPGCPLCRATDSVEVTVADCSAHPSYRFPLSKTIRWLRCRGCDHEYVEGYLCPAALSIIFADTLPHQDPGDNIENSRNISARMVENVCGLLPVPSGWWLDVGFGNGSLMTTAAEFGFETVGIDLRSANVEKMRQIGYEAHAVEFEVYRPNLTFDVISMADVLEHMPFPTRALEHAHSLLRQGGLLFMSMPNSDSFLWKVLTAKRANPYWKEIEHCHNFGRKRLYSLLREYGFEPVRYGVSQRYRACMEVIAVGRHPLVGATGSAIPRRPDETTSES